MEEKSLRQIASKNIKVVDSASVLRQKPSGPDEVADVLLGEFGYVALPTRTRHQYVGERALCLWGTLTMHTWECSAFGLPSDWRKQVAAIDARWPGWLSEEHRTAEGFPYFSRMVPAVTA